MQRKLKPRRGGKCMSYQIPWSRMSLQICGKMMIEAAKFGPRCYRPFLQYSFSVRKIFRIRYLISDVRWKSWILLLMPFRPQFWSSRVVLHACHFILFYHVIFISIVKKTIKSFSLIYNVLWIC